MKQVCYLHIGSPKTGSTSLQALCFRNRKLLEKGGLLYPGEHKRHNALVSAFHKKAHELRFNRLKVDLSKNGLANDILDDEIQTAKSSTAQNVLFSNEVLLGQAHELDLKLMFERMNKEFDEVRVLCYIRDPYRHLISRCQENVKSGVRTYESICRKPPVLDMRALDAFVDVCGREALILKNFDGLRSEGGSLTEDFLQTVLPDDSVLEELQEVKQQNVGITLEAALLLSGINAKYGLNGDWSGRHVKTKDFKDIGSTPFSIPSHAVLAARDDLLEQYEYLNSLGLTFLPPDWNALPDVKPDWSHDTLEQISLWINDLAGKSDRPKKKRK